MNIKGMLMGLFCFASLATKNIDYIAATVGNQPVLKSDLSSEKDLEEVVRQNLLRQACEKNGFWPKAEEIHAVIEQIKKQHGLDDEKLEKSLATNGMTRASYQEMLAFERCSEFLIRQKRPNTQLIQTYGEVQRYFHVQYIYLSGLIEETLIQEHIKETRSLGMLQKKLKIQVPILEAKLHEGEWIETVEKQLLQVPKGHLGYVRIGDEWMIFEVISMTESTKKGLPKSSYGDNGSRNKKETLDELIHNLKKEIPVVYLINK